MNNIYFNEQCIKLILEVYEVLKKDKLLTDDILDNNEFIIEINPTYIKIYHGEGYDRVKSNLYFDHEIYNTFNLFDIMLKGINEKYNFFHIQNYDINKLGRDMWILEKIKKEMMNNDR